MNNKRYERPSRASSTPDAKKKPEPQKAQHITDDEDSSPRRIVSTGDTSVGTITHDDLGQARWTWATELGSASARSTDDTFDLLKALDNDALELANDSSARVPAGTEPVGGGYNPYDTARVKNLPKPRKR